MKLLTHTEVYEPILYKKSALANDILQLRE